jgi:hypothetical protein
MNDDITTDQQGMTFKDIVFLPYLAYTKCLGANYND